MIQLGSINQSTHTQTQSYSSDVYDLWFMKTEVISGIFFIQLQTTGVTKMKSITHHAFTRYLLAYQDKISKTRIFYFSFKYFIVILILLNNKQWQMKWVTGTRIWIRYTKKKKQISNKSGWHWCVKLKDINQWKAVCSVCAQPPL